MLRVQGLGFRVQGSCFYTCVGGLFFASLLAQGGVQGSGPWGFTDARGLMAYEFGSLRPSELNG